MKNLLIEIGKIVGTEELKAHASNPIISDVIKEINIELRSKFKPELKKVKGGMYDVEPTNMKIAKADRPEHPKLIKGWREHMETQNSKKKPSIAPSL